ncbi:1-phosphofructokinase [Vibrio neptunius]|uniref:1-phosphofructokinase n=1 Tax=Vibrio neptunius TaxID=170651 RepID=UPI0019CF6021|nr:1-phosphofructokinase [Vibrio neptunius]MBN3572045.1 1-phosphofructokinase [Vibrio neptunius]QXX08712.1 1-phosphofructokinase [Vibrio neptunius]
MTNKVVTITLNPALDLTGSLTSLKPGSVSLVNESSLHAAGKGVNVAKVLSDLGAEVTVTGFLGKDNQEMFCQLFKDIGADDQFIRVHGATRINVKLVEQSGKVSDVNFPGVTVDESALVQFEQKLEQLVEVNDYFVLAGSLPKGITPERCASWISYLQEKGKKVLFDSSRAALKAGISSAPWLIKPNDEELSDYVGHPLKSAKECQSAAEELSKLGIENVVVSMGSQGVMWLSQNEWIQCQPPSMNVVSTVGAGDTLVAGLCWGHMQSLNKTELLSFATALSALAVSQVGVGVPDIKQVHTLQEQIKINLLSDQKA